MPLVEFLVFESWFEVSRVGVGVRGEGAVKTSSCLKTAERKWNEIFTFKKIHIHISTISL